MSLFIDPIDLVKSLDEQATSDEQSKTQEVMSSLLDWNGIIELLEGNLPVLFVKRENEDEIINPVFIITSRIYSFQNLKSIDLVFTKVTGKPFLDKIENREAELNYSPHPAEDLINKYAEETKRINLAKRNRFANNNWASQIIDLETKRLEIPGGRFILKKEFPNWREKIESLFKLRNEFVHSTTSNELSRDEMKDFLVISDRFVKAVRNYLFEDFWYPSHKWQWEDPL